MKYMTKEWYETMQNCDLHVLLKVFKKAEVYSEAYFKELYQWEEKEWLRLQKEISEITFEDTYPEDFEEYYAECAYDEPLEGAEYEEAKKAYYEERERAKLDYEKNPNPPFDPEREKKVFRQSFRYNIKVLKEELPEEILQNVADIRVLALDRASAELKKQITQYCKQNEKAVRYAMNAYDKQYAKQFKNGAPAFAEELHLHDCIVKSCRKAGNDVVLTLDNSGSFTAINRIRMKNCHVIKQDSPLHGAWCLYEEIYKTGERFEIHFLLQKNDLIDYIVSVDDVEYQYE